MTTAFVILSILVVILGVVALRAEYRVDALTKRVQQLEEQSEQPAPTTK